MVELDESTAILVRVDPKSPLIDSILTQYKKGGEMFETIEAMKTTNGRISPILQDLLNRVHSNNLTDVDIANESVDFSNPKYDDDIFTPVNDVPIRIFYLQIYYFFIFIMCLL